MGKRIIILILITSIFNGCNGKFRPKNIINLSNNYNSIYKIDISAQEYVGQDNYKWNKNYINVKDLSHNKENNIIFTIDTSHNKLKKANDRYFFYREFKVVNEPCQIWELDLTKGRVRYLMDWCCDYAISKTGRYMILFKKYTGLTEKNRIYWGTTFKILDLEENRYIKNYDLTKKIKAIYPKELGESESISVNLKYDIEKKQFYIDTQFASYENSTIWGEGEYIGEIIPIYIDDIYE